MSDPRRSRSPAGQISSLDESRSRHSSISSLENGQYAPTITNTNAFEPPSLANGSTSETNPSNPASNVQQAPYRQENQLEQSPPESEKLIESNFRHSPWRTKDLWTWELFSILTSLACLAAIVTVLAVVNQKPLAWWRFPIRPNALISVFSAVAKATFLLPVAECISQSKWHHFSRGPRPLADLQRFDDASRGPWGSFMFLFTRKPTHTTLLASLGCIITISALAVDPFTQQIISYPSRSTQLAALASTPVATAYDGGNFTKSGTFDPEFTDDQMQAAIIAGIFNIEDTTESLLNCPAGNCTWPEFSTLGVCGSCRNVTTLSQKNCPDERISYSASPRTCNYTTPGGENLTATAGPSGSATYFYTMLNSTASEAAVRDDMPEMTKADIVNVGILRVQPSTGSVGLPDDAEIHECALQWCIRTYGAVTRAGLAKKSKLVHSEPLFWNEMRRVGDPLYYEIGSRDDKQQKYLLNVVDMIGTGRILSSLFSTSMASQLARVSVDEGFSISRTLYKTSNLSTTFETIATSMTNRLRSGRNLTEVSGQAWGNETYIEVDWPWIALPSALILLTAVLLVTSALLSRREKLWLWKSSLLPYLFYGLEREVIDNANLNGKVSQLDDVANSTNAKLSKERTPRIGLEVYEKTG